MGSSPFLAAVFGSFLGKLLAALFIAICFYLGFGPSKWAEWFIGNMMTPEAARIGFAVLGSVVLILLVGSFFVRSPKAELRAEVSASLAPFPDWPIADLFHYIDADILDDTGNEPAWQRVGLDIKDKLSIGILRAWGRRVGSRDSPFVPIRAAYWGTAHWSYWFFKEDGKNDVHVFTESEVAAISGQEEYADVHVNRHQALGIWPAGAPGSKISKLEKRLDSLDDPRLLTQDQLTKMTIALNGHKGTLWVTRDIGSAETGRVQSQVRRFFERAGWDVAIFAVMGIDDPPECGLAILSRGGPKADETALIAALDAAKIPFEIRYEDVEGHDGVTLQLNFSDV